MAAAAAPSPIERPPSPDPEVIPKARRRTFSAEYKLRILREAETCTKPRQIGALLRREGLYSSHLTEWGRRRDKGFLAAAGERQRGRRAKPTDPSAKRVAELERENRRLSEKLRKAQIIIDFQKKVQALLSMQDEEGKL
jgi:transposase-like protein